MDNASSGFALSSDRNLTLMALHRAGGIVYSHRIAVAIVQESLGWPFATMKTQYQRASDRIVRPSRFLQLCATGFYVSRSADPSVRQ
jgi:hypothetical protein